MNMNCDILRLSEAGTELTALLQDQGVRNFLEMCVGMDEAQQLIDDIIDLYTKQEQGMVEQISLSTVASLRK